MIEVLGLDLSLRATGWADSSGVGVARPKTKGVERLEEIVDWLNVRLYYMQPAELVLIEGYSYGSKNGGERLGELGGVVRLNLYGRGIPYVEVPPTSLKKYATGVGNASKDAVLISGVKRSGIEFTDNNACDAFWLRQMGLAHYAPDHPELIAMPQLNMTALDVIDWPELVTA